VPPTLCGYVTSRSGELRVIYRQRESVGLRALTDIEMHTKGFSISSGAFFLAHLKEERCQKVRKLAGCRLS